MRSEIEVLPLYSPSLPFSYQVHVLAREQTLVGSPVVGVANADRDMGYTVQQLLQHFVFAPAVFPGDDDAAVLLSKVPGPPLVSLRADKRPEFVPFRDIIVELDLKLGKLLSLDQV